MVYVRWNEQSRQEYPECNRNQGNRDEDEKIGWESSAHGWLTI
jgi:hypothetical protein